jgi:hypothetical protein
VEAILTRIDQEFTLTWPVMIISEAHKTKEKRGQQSHAHFSIYDRFEMLGLLRRAYSRIIQM